MLFCSMVSYFVAELIGLLGVCCILYDQNNPEVPSSTICYPGDSDLTGYWQFHTYHFKCWW